MQGSLFKRCTKCGRRVTQRRCKRCGSSSFNWGYSVDVGTAADGRRKQRRRSGFATEAEAEQALREVLSALDGHSYVAPSELTVAGFLREHWLPAVQPPKLRPSTWVEYRRIVRLRIAPRIGGVTLQGLNPAHLNVRGHDKVPAGGQLRSPLVATKSPRWWPAEVPTPLKHPFVASLGR